MNYALPANNLYSNEPIMLELPGNWDVNICSFKGEKATTLTEQQILEKIQSPIGIGSIAKEAKGCKNAVIIFDDISRPTPIEPIAKAVISELEKAGVPRDKIRFVCSIGSHRASYREDYVRKLGEDITQEFRIYSHNPFFNNVYLGKTSSGVPIELNAECVHADFKIGIGAVFPHPSTGLGGGGKLILPGIASMESIRRFHMVAAQFRRWSIDSQAMEETLQAADMLGLNFKIDALLNGKGEIANIYCGDHRRNIKDPFDEIMDFYTTEHAGPADLVIANNYFKPTEPNVVLATPGIIDSVIEGGDLIVAAHTPQGCAPHYTFGKWGDTQIGGTMYGNGNGQIPKHINKYFAFSKYLDKGVGAMYHLDQVEDIWFTEWSEILKELGNEPKKVAIYPYATVCYFNKIYT